MSSRSLYIGIMSGTSLDGADAVVADFSAAHPRARAFASEPYSTDLRTELLALNQAGENEIARSHLAANQLAHVYSRAALSAMRAADIDAGEIVAIGCHGQTVRHRPDLHFTVQLNNPALLAELTGCNVVADFRSRDLAAGGQGAPLVPVFHDGIFRRADEVRVIANIGGIANLTILAPRQPAWGFDCGPGNCLMDAWNAAQQATPYDKNGNWAARGRVLPGLLRKFLADGYFQSLPPKSTGRDRFNMDWLTSRLDATERPEDVQATLLALTAQTIMDHIASHAPAAQRILVCGGGANNLALMNEMTQKFSCGSVERTDAYGVPAQQVEGLAFAWLAMRAIERRSVDMTATTGASHPCILGAFYPA